MTSDTPITLVTDEEISLGTLIDKVRSNDAGAIVTFVGVVREDREGNSSRVEAIDYHAFDEMAVKTLEELIREIKDRWKGILVAVSFRKGILNVGEASVAIAVSAPHRKEAFEACRFAIDKLKETVPIWKKELWKGPKGNRWL